MLGSSKFRCDVRCSNTYQYADNTFAAQWVDPLGAGIVEAAENGTGHHAGVNGNGDAGSPDLSTNGRKSSTIDVPLLIQNSERFT